MVKAIEYEDFYRWCFGIDYKDYIDGKIPDAVLMVFWNKAHGEDLLIRDLNHFHNRKYEIEYIWRSETGNEVKRGWIPGQYSKDKPLIRTKPKKVKDGKAKKVQRRRVSRG